MKAVAHFYYIFLSTKLLSQSTFDLYQSFVLKLSLQASPKTNLHFNSFFFRQISKHCIFLQGIYSEFWVSILDVFIITGFFFFSEPVITFNVSLKEYTLVNLQENSLTVLEQSFFYETILTAIAKLPLSNYHLLPRQYK